MTKKLKRPRKKKEISSLSLLRRDRLQMRIESIEKLIQRLKNDIKILEMRLEMEKKTLAYIENERPDELLDSLTDKNKQV